MGPAILALVILALIGIGLVLYFVALYNNLVGLKNDFDKAWANIDVLLKQRHDELPKLIEACKGYMQYEQKRWCNTWRPKGHSPIPYARSYGSPRSNSISIPFGARNTRRGSNA
jgi:LemA family